MRLVFHGLNLGHPSIDAWFGGMYRSFFSALRSAGAEVVYAPPGVTRDGDVLVVPVGGGQDRIAARAMAAFSGPAVLYAPSAQSWFRHSFLARWKDQLLFAYGTDEAPRTRDLYGTAGIEYRVLPFASDPGVMRPLELPPLYDVVFVGNASSGAGRTAYVRALVEEFGTERVLVVGPGWASLGYPEQSVAWGPLLNTLYGLSRVCVNVHNTEQSAAPAARLDANNRLFDLGMAGRPQVCAGSASARPYFSEDEVIGVDTPAEMCAAVSGLLADAGSAERLGASARARALKDHAWAPRAAQFLEWISESLRRWERQPDALPLAWLRKRDELLPPYGFAEARRKADRRLRRLLRGRVS